VRVIDLYCATANPSKQREFQQAASSGVIVHRLGQCSCPEEGSSFDENAISKALCYCSALQPKNALGDDALVFADDSGLVVDALDGAPGIYSARFAGSDATDDTNNQKLIRELREIPEDRRTGRFICSIALVRNENILGVFHGRAEGEILTSPTGGGGFGYDPLFFYPPLKKTFAELSGETKWECSHRGKAFRAMGEMLRKEQ
jgi:XTP/dITP diphosphohydrolase